MVFFNIQPGDAPYLKSLADAYTMSDNYHQAVLGGTGANHIMLGTGDAIWFSDGGQSGSPAEQSGRSADPGLRSPGIPPLCRKSKIQIRSRAPTTTIPRTAMAAARSCIGGESANANYGGGSYVKCADSGQHGVGAVTSYLAAIKPSIKPNCEAGHY